VKIKKEFLLKQVAGENIVVSTDAKAVNFSGMLVLNKTGTFLFNLLQDDLSLEELVGKMLEKFDVDEFTAKRDCLEFVNKLRTNNIID
jgi:hypothetical protein